MAPIYAGKERLGLQALLMLATIVLSWAESESGKASAQEDVADALSPDQAQQRADSWDGPFMATLTVDTPMKNQTRHIGDRVVFDCEITGKPTPKYKWFKDAEELDGDESATSSNSNRRYKIQDQDWGSRLRIMKATEEDKGTYRCLAENAWGMRETNAVLKLKIALPTAVAPTMAPRSATTTPEEENDDDDVDPYCQIYKGNYCGFLRGQQIYVTSRKSQHLADSRLMRLLSELSPPTHSMDTSQCSQKAREATCHYQMPLCAYDTATQRPYPKRLCQADCEALVSLCRSEFRGNSKAWQLLPNCRELPSNSDCIQMGLVPRTTPAAAVTDLRHMEQAIPAEDDLMHMLKIVIPCSVGVIAIIAIVGGVCACKRRKARMAGGKGQPPKTTERKGAQEMSLVSTAAGGVNLGEKNMAFVKEVPAVNVHMMQELGEGEFGKIFVGQVLGLFGSGTSAVVLVKTLREKAPSAVASSFRKEIEEMVEIRHQHVALLLGVSLKGSLQCAFYEYLPMGDLHQVLSRSPEAASSAGQRLASSSPQLQLREQMYVVTQVASALEYLCSISRVHGDVAARNVLVGHGLIVKLSSLSITFGLHSADYCQLHGRPTPIRWLPPEAVIYGKRTLEADVYSFGVLMWEVFSHAVEKPYAGCSNQEVMAMVRSRQLLPCPAPCPPRIYSLMMECWHEAPAKRPAARELHQKLRAWYLEGGVAPTLTQTAPPQPVDWLTGSVVTGSSGSSVAPSIQSYSSSASATAGGGNPSNSTNLTDIRSSNASATDPAASTNAPLYYRQAPLSLQSTIPLQGQSAQQSPNSYSDAAGSGTPPTSAVGSGHLMPTFSSPYRRYGDLTPPTEY